ncbi:hypothetical protein ACTPEM_26145, partial [Clostridioides difficile]
YKVEGDYSQGAFYLSADAIGEDISILDLKEDSLQGDSEVVEIPYKCHYWDMLIFPNHFLIRI